MEAKFWDTQFSNMDQKIRNTVTYKVHMVHSYLQVGPDRFIE